MDYGIFNEVEFISNSSIKSLNEGARFDYYLTNFLKEGGDYKGLKASMKKVIKAVNLSDEEFKQNSNKIINIAKRTIQIILDIICVGVDAIEGFGTGMLLVYTGPFNVINWLIWMIGFILTKLVTRVLRLAVDTAEYKSCLKEANQLVEILENKASSIDGEKEREKYNKQIDILKKKIKFYSK